MQGRSQGRKGDLQNAGEISGKEEGRSPECRGDLRVGGGEICRVVGGEIWGRFIG